MARIARTVATVLTVTVTSAAPVGAAADDPHFESRITATPGLPAGVDISVRGGDDELVLDNGSDRDLVVRGYDGEPYVRFAADGTVAVNDDSPATYLNTVRDGRVSVPEGVDGRGEPRWRTVDRSGRFAWFDHRIHWMSETLPPQVTDPGEETEIFEWSVPVSVAGDGTRAAITGTLAWTPDGDDGIPAWTVVLFALVLAGGAAAVLEVRRRRIAPPLGRRRR